MSVSVVSGSTVDVVDDATVCSGRRVVALVSAGGSARLVVAAVYPLDGGGRVFLARGREEKESVLPNSIETTRDTQVLCYLSVDMWGQPTAGSVRRCR